MASVDLLNIKFRRVVVPVARTTGAGSEREKKKRIGSRWRGIKLPKAAFPSTLNIDSISPPSGPGSRFSPG